SWPGCLLRRWLRCSWSKRPRSSTVLFFFSSRRRHTRFSRDWSSDVCSSDLATLLVAIAGYFITRTFFDPAVGAIEAVDAARTGRSEERRVGKECRSRGSTYH